VMEHFSFDMQPLLTEYQNCNNNSIRMSFDELVRRYQEIGTEQHDLEPYRALLEYARRNPQRIRLHAGFLSRRYARMLLQPPQKGGGGPAAVWEQAARWLPPRTAAAEAAAFEADNQLLLWKGSEWHYQLFERLIRGVRPLWSSTSGSFNNGENLAAQPTSSSSPAPSDRFRGIFQAQLLKDVAMAHRVQQILHDIRGKNEKILVIAGNGHVLYGCGVPERVRWADDGDDDGGDLTTTTTATATSAAVSPEEDSCLVVSLPVSSTEDDSSASSTLMSDLRDMYGPEGSNPADFVFAYRENTTLDIAAAAAKAETAMAYDKVGESAHLPGNQAKAAAIMKALGYTPEEFKVAGEDACNFQGVGNPHRHAHIRVGETVLDVGSGLGIDSFIASAATGPQGKVIGIDISSSEVAHAQKRARERGLDLRFVTAEMENLPLPDESVDVVISNGAFCLVPDKAKALAEMLRVLKPGGRISVCTSTILPENHLESGVSWPLCMQMFIAKSAIQPLCEQLGFVDVVVDDSDSSFSIELPEEALAGMQEDKEATANPSSSSARNKVHVGSPEFRHLEKYDMDEICARVCITARKPENKEATDGT